MRITKPIIKKKITLLITIILLILTFNISFSNVYGDENNPSTTNVPEPSTSGFVLDAYDTTRINVSVNQSHFHFWNEYVDESITHIDFFVPDALQDDLGYLTPCNPSLMVCQEADAPDPIYGYWDLFHILNDWTNQYSDRFYIETDYIFNYAQYDSDSDIPDGWNWLRVNQNVTVNYSSGNSGIGDLLNTVVEIDDSHSIRINVFSTNHNLVLNYTYFYNDNITGSFEDTYGDYVPDDISEIINFKSVDNRLDVSLNKNNPTVQYYKNDDAFFNVSYDIGDTENISIDLSNNTYYQHYDDKDFVFYPVNDSGRPSFEYGLEFKAIPSSNELFFDIEHNGLVFIEEHDGILAKFDTGDDVQGLFNNVGSCFRIPTPVIFDSDNNCVNGTVEIIGNQLKIVIPQSFLDTAVYPVFVDPSFTLLDSQDDGGYYKGVWGGDDYIYAACNDDGIRAYSFNGSTFTLLDTHYDGGSYYKRLWYDGTYIYAACDYDGIKAYSFNGSDFTLLDSQYDGGGYRGVWDDGNYIYAACKDDGIRAYSFNGSDFTLLDTQYDSGIYYHVWGNGTYIYTACSNDGIRAYSFNGSDFTLLDTQDDGNNYNYIWGDGTYIYASCLDDGIRAYSFDGSDFTLLDSQDDGDNYVSVWGDGTYVYAACYGSGIRAYSFNGSDFTLEDTIDDGDNYHGVWGDGTYVYTACDSSGIRAYGGFESNSAPTITGEVPNNQSTGISLQPTVNVTVSDADSDTMNVTFASNYSGSWVNYQTTTSVSSGTSVEWDFTDANSLNTTYYWRVYADDGTDNVSEIYNFTTCAEPQNGLSLTETTTNLIMFIIIFTIITSLLSFVLKKINW